MGQFPLHKMVYALIVIECFPLSSVIPFPTLHYIEYMPI